MYLVLEKLYQNVKILLKIDKVRADTINYSKTVVPLYLTEWYFMNVKRVWQSIDVWCHSDSVRRINNSGIYAFCATYIFLRSYRKIMFCTCRRGVQIDGLEKYKIVLVNELLYAFFFFEDLYTIYHCPCLHIRNKTAYKFWFFSSLFFKFLGIIFYHIQSSILLYLWLFRSNLSMPCRFISNGEFDMTLVLSIAAKS